MKGTNGYGMYRGSKLIRHRRHAVARGEQHFRKTTVRVDPWRFGMVSLALTLHQRAVFW